MKSNSVWSRKYWTWIYRWTVKQSRISCSIRVDVNQEIIDKINEDKKYTIFVKDVESDEIVITDISGVNSTKPELIDEVKEAEIITTAVG